MLLSDDLFQELNYAQLYTQYLATKREWKLYRMLKVQGSFNQDDIRLWVDPYMDILERNLQQIYERLMLIAEDTYYFHLDT